MISSTDDMCLLSYRRGIQLCCCFICTFHLVKLSQKSVAFSKEHVLIISSYWWFSCASKTYWKRQ